MRQTCQRRGCGSSDKTKSFRGHGKAGSEDADAASQHRIREILYLLRWMPDGVRLMQFLGKMFLQCLLHCLSAAMVAEPAVTLAAATWNRAKLRPKDLLADASERNRFRAKRSRFRSSSAEHDLAGKPASTFPDHAPQLSMILSEKRLPLRLADVALSLWGKNPLPARR
jgi:hypothetical protein